MKHTLKRWLREAYSRTLYHTGLWRVANRLAPRRLTILAGHCVDAPAINAGLPSDMKIAPQRLELLLRVLGKHFELVTVGGGVTALDAGVAGRSMVALSMDDGYLDNRTDLLPLLQRVGAAATIYLESRPLDERRVNWSHKYFWLLEERGLAADFLGRRLMERLEEPRTLEALRRALEQTELLAYHVKHALKYDADAAERDTVLDELFLAEGGDEAALCARIYMTWEQARELQDAGLELGGHTVRHEVLSTLSGAQQLQEVQAGGAALDRALGEDGTRTFAYPFGRRWDWNAESQEAVHASGFLGAVTTHAGTNTRSSERTALARWMIDGETPLHHLVTEAAGGFLLLRRLGLELAE